MKARADMFPDALNNPDNERFWLSRIQTYNWGTYSGAHDFQLAREGYMFVGPSGSGKSTALDAHATLMTPPKWLRFNVAAVGTSAPRSDRTLLTYIRGAWGDKSVEQGSLEAERQYLRPTSTWSIISETYRNDAGSVVTLAQVLWVRGTTTSSSDVKRRYLILERDLDIRELQAFADSDFNARALKAQMPDAVIKDDFSGYQETYRRLLSIESESALRLLHKTQSAKDLADLNGFLRDFMLDVPETFGIADDLVEQFSELNEAHDSVLQAERQIEILQPARDAANEALDARRKRSEFEEISNGIDAHVEQTKAALLRDGIAALETSIVAATEDARALREAADLERRRLESLEAERLGLGGREIRNLEAEIQFAESQKGDRIRKRDQLDAACTLLGWELPTSAESLAELCQRAKAAVDDAPERQGAEEERALDLRQRRAARREELEKVEREIRAMHAHHSNIGSRLLDLRETLCHELRIEREEMPFAGELIEVVPDEAQWQGAIERVLGGFAISLLVPERYYRSVSDWINERHLGARLVYFRIAAADRPALDRAVGPQSLIRKLGFADHPHVAWVREELKSRFDYACVNTMDEFRAAPRMAVTARGQVKHNGTRHEKNDTYSISDPDNWVLGFNNATKLQSYERRAREAAAAISELDKEIALLSGARKNAELATQRCVIIANTAWADVDVFSMAERVSRLEAQLEQERRSRPELSKLEEQIESQQKRFDGADKLAREKQQEALDHERRRSRLAADLEQLRPERLSLVLTPTQQGGLRERFANCGRMVTLGSIDEVARLVERALNTESSALAQQIDHLENAALTQFGEFIRNWPSEAAGLDQTMSSADDFFAKLDRLVTEGLPRFRERFERLLHDHSAQALSRLASRLDMERAAISERLDFVNESLRSREYNAGTRLEIAAKDRISDDLRQFKADLRAALSHSNSNDRKHAEERFIVLSRIVKRLGSLDPVDRLWKQQALDVRQHVEFIARELDSSGLEVEVYRGGGGKSGGQRQKLTLSCLAAALRFQLGGDDGSAPKYRTVVIDEAFEKADADFTTLTMRIFESMGFQMVVATPMKAVMALEPFIGGACFVFSPNRKSSATLPIDYDPSAKRLLLDANLRGQAVAEADGVDVE